MSVLRHRRFLRGFPRESVFYEGLYARRKIYIYIESRWRGRGGGRGVFFLFSFTSVIGPSRVPREPTGESRFVYFPILGGRKDYSVQSGVFFFFRLSGFVYYYTRLRAALPIQNCVSTTAVGQRKRTVRRTFVNVTPYHHSHYTRLAVNVTFVPKNVFNVFTICVSITRARIVPYQTAHPGTTLVD